MGSSSEDVRFRPDRAGATARGRAGEIRSCFRAALAGANHRAAAGQDGDGILTAEEIASLDLSSVEWAVLSACNTASGDIREGEGVLGLQRAFQIAGARTLVMSLWPVDDRATRRWMEQLYDGHLRRGLDTAEAVRSAMQSALADRRRKGLDTHPFYWAGFIAAGDWH
jgi:CHAT domain-containing protein